MMPLPMAAHSVLPSGFRVTSLQWQWPMRPFGNRRYPSGYGVSPAAAAFPGSQLSNKFGSGIAARTWAASAAVAVLQVISFSSTSLIPDFGATAAASRNFSLIALRYGA